MNVNISECSMEQLEEMQDYLRGATQAAKEEYYDLQDQLDEVNEEIYTRQNIEERP